MQGKYDEAKPLYERSMRIYKHVHGREHPYVATALNNLAKLLSAQVRNEQFWSAESSISYVLEALRHFK